MSILVADKGETPLPGPPGPAPAPLDAQPHIIYTPCIDVWTRGGKGACRGARPHRRRACRVSARYLLQGVRLPPLASCWQTVRSAGGCLVVSPRLCSKRGQMSFCWDQATPNTAPVPPKRRKSGKRATPRCTGRHCDNALDEVRRGKTNTTQLAWCTEGPAFRGVKRKCLRQQHCVLRVCSRHGTYYTSAAYSDPPQFFPNASRSVYVYVHALPACGLRQTTAT